MPSDVKEHGVNITLSTLATLAVVIPAFWFIFKPLVVESISAAVADDIDTKVEEKQKPLGNAFKVLLKADIDRLRRDIAKLVYKERHDADHWTEEDAGILADKEIELTSLLEAYSEL